MNSHIGKVESVRQLVAELLCKGKDAFPAVSTSHAAKAQLPVAALIVPMTWHEQVYAFCGTRKPNVELSPRLVRGRPAGL